MSYFNNMGGYNFNGYPMANYSPPYTPPQQSKHSDLLQVNGLEGARNYPVSPNCRVVLFDSNSDVFYIKSTDAGGYPSISAFSFAPMQEQQLSSQNFATKQDLETILQQIQNLSNEVKQYGKLTISAKGDNAKDEPTTPTTATPK